MSNRDDWADLPEFRVLVENEFPSLAPLLRSCTSRRKFLQLMGASVALAGVTGCRWPKETIVPYVDRPQGRTPGVPVQYATAMELGGAATGLLVTSYDGRPIKIEGNPSHPFSRGTTNTWQQASLLELYDPDRSTHPFQLDGSARADRTWDEFLAFAGPHFSELRKTQGERFAVLCEASSSPSAADLKGRLGDALPKAAWYEYEPISHDNQREGTRLAFGRLLRPHLHLDRAKVVVSLDSDFLMTHPAAVKCAGDFAAGRRGDNNELSRLYVFESNHTVTGGMADRRVPVRASLVPSIARRLYADVSQIVGAEKTSPGPPELPEFADMLRAPLDDLAAHRGQSVIVAGHHQPAEVHALAHALNAMLGNIGSTVTFTDEPDPDRLTHAEAIVALVGRMNAGEIDTLLLLGGNPVYNAPAALNFGEALKKVATSVHLSLYDDETSRTCTWHLPRAHYLESWGDARAYDGTYSIVQPLIQPLYDGKTSCELLALVLGDEMPSSHAIARRTFADLFGDSANSDRQWKQSLHDGVVPDTAWTEHTPKLQPMELPELPPLELNGFEVILVEDYSVYDGRFGNNGWLQELPDPITKLTWDNAALISMADAQRLGVKTPGDVIRIEHDEHALDIAAFPLPGHADGSITIPLGYGRDGAGVIAEGAGANVAALLPTDGSRRVAGAKASATGAHYRLATAQDSPAIRSAVGDEEAARRVAEELIKVATIDQYAQNPTFAKHEVHGQPLWKDWSYEDGHKWGMAVDLSACIGCSACVVACQAENNIPIVGKDEVAIGRDMHWIRVDRYFQDAKAHEDDHGANHQQDGVDSGSVQLLHQPMTCHHCETAPCEQVCPVAATMHDQEGLSVMVYSRCIGTRYCNNNCPFKVRRFNWFWNHHGPHHPRTGEELTDIEKMIHNPDVTVRSRGVMEKCSFCAQRISAVKSQAKNEGWDRIPDGMITPACAQACPTGAIVFGDLNDPESRVRKLHNDDRAYELLPQLNLKSRLLYLARLTNPSGDVGQQRSDGADYADDQQHGAENNDVPHGKQG